MPEQPVEPASTSTLDDMFGDLTISNTPEENLVKPQTEDLFGENQVTPPVSSGMEQLNEMYNQASQPASTYMPSSQPAFGAPSNT